MGVSEQFFKPDEVAAVVEVLDGEAVAQGVWADFLRDSGAGHEYSYDMLDAAHGDAARGGFSGVAPEEVIGWFCVTKVGDEVLADGFVVGQRALLSAFRLTDDERALLAVEVVQADPGNLAGAQSETEKEAENEPVFGPSGGGKE